MARRVLDDELRNRAVDLVADGASYAAAAKECGVVWGTVKRWCKTAGVEPKPRFSYDDEVRAKAVEAVRKGESARAVGLRMDIGGNTVAYWCRQAGVALTREHRPTTGNQANIDAVLRHVRAGVSYEEAGRRVGISEGAARTICARAGVEATAPHGGQGRRYPPGHKERAWRSFEAGQSAARIAVELDVKPETVREWHRRWAKRRDVLAAVTLANRSGNRMPGIAQAHGITLVQLLKWCVEANVRPNGLDDRVHELEARLERVRAERDELVEDVARGRAQLAEARKNVTAVDGVDPALVARAEAQTRQLRSRVAELEADLAGKLADGGAEARLREENGRLLRANEQLEDRLAELTLGGDTLMVGDDVMAAPMPELGPGDVDLEEAFPERGP